MTTYTTSATETHAIPAKKNKRHSNKTALVQRAQRGEGEAFSEIFEIHKRQVYSLCLSMTKNVSEAEDLTQEVFLQVFRNVASFRGDSAFSTWMYRVAINTVLMKLRHTKYPPMLSLDEPVSPESPSAMREFGAHDPSLSSAVDRITLGRAIQELPPGCKKILSLHAIQGYQHREIAELLKCSIGNSKSQLHRAKLKLRSLLSPKWSATFLGKGVWMTEAATNQSDKDIHGNVQY